MANLQTVGVIFGGRSVEHDISIITGLQIMRAMDREKYQVVPIYITREGEWLTGDALADLRAYSGGKAPAGQPATLGASTAFKGLISPPVAGPLKRSQLIALDVLFPAIHGSHGEDGTLQGLFELIDLPYVGCGVGASAVAVDKILTKAVLAHHGVPVVAEYVSGTRAAWRADKAGLLARIRGALSFPVYVKPASLGSSIGVSRATDDQELEDAIELAAQLDPRFLVERAMDDCIEINCAVLGAGAEVTPSVCEQPVKPEALLSFEDKYMQKPGVGMQGAKRIVPAPISEALTAKVQAAAVEAFQAVGGAGIARVDLLVNVPAEQVYVNEMNTLPGSLSFYLWEPTGIKPAALIDRLIALATEAHAEKARSRYTFPSYVLQQLSPESLGKGGK